MSKVAVVALSVNSEVARSHFIKTYHNIVSESIDAILFTQSYEYLSEDSHLICIRDDSVLGQPISKVRDYFTKYINLSKYDYILFADDDFLFNKESRNILEKHIEYFDSHNDVGLINFRFLNSSKNFIRKDYTKCNPANVYMKSGILVKTSILDSFEFPWGSDKECIYYEECILGMNIYTEGYKILEGKIPIIHRTVSTGLGKTLERNNPFERDPNFKGGRQILYHMNLVSPKIDNEGLNFRRKPSLTDKAKDLHIKNHKIKFEG